MLRYRGSADGKARGNIAGAAAALGEQLDDPAAVRIGKGEKGVHVRILQ